MRYWLQPACSHACGLSYTQDGRDRAVALPKARRFSTEGFRRPRGSRQHRHHYGPGVRENRWYDAHGQLALYLTEDGGRIGLCTTNARAGDGILAMHGAKLPIIPRPGGEMYHFWRPLCVGCDGRGVFRSLPNVIKYDSRKPLEV